MYRTYPKKMFWFKNIW